MDADDLIRNIVREVLNQLRGTTEKACVLVLAERDEVLASEVRQLAGEDSDVLFFGEDIGKRVPERYILPNLCCAAMADLAGGRASGKFLTEVLRLLLTGQKVEVLHFGYTAYAETAPGPLYELYTSHRKTLGDIRRVGVQEKTARYVRIQGVSCNRRGRRPCPRGRGVHARGSCGGDNHPACGRNGQEFGYQHHETVMRAVCV